MSESSADTRSSLIVRLREEDNQAWSEFFRIYAPAVFSYSLRRGMGKDDAEDIAQEVMIEVARSIKNFTYRREIGRFRDWLGTITRRRMASVWNRHKLSTLDVDENNAMGQVDGQWIDEYQAAILLVAIENIRSRYSNVTWEAFWSTWKLGETAPQVSSRLGIPIECVYNAKARILKHLEKEVMRISDDIPFPPE